MSVVTVVSVPSIHGPLKRLGLEYRHERLGMRNMVEKFFRYLKEKTMIFTIR
jgi:hypothetical protein